MTGLILKTGVNIFKGDYCHDGRIIRRIFQLWWFSTNHTTVDAFSHLWLCFFFLLSRALFLFGVFCFFSPLIWVSWCRFCLWFNHRFPPLSLSLSLAVLSCILTTRSRSFLSHHMSSLGLSRKSRFFSKTSSISEEHRADCRSVALRPTSNLQPGLLPVCCRLTNTLQSCSCSLQHSVRCHAFSPFRIHNHCHYLFYVLLQNHRPITCVSHYHVYFSYHTSLRQLLCKLV